MTGTPALLILVVSAVACWSSVECFSAGPPVQACGTLSPLQAGHNAPAQTTPVPYEIDLSSLDDGNGGFAYVPGETYSLTVQSTDPAEPDFRGVLLQGRLMSDDTTPAGSFEEPTDTLLSVSNCVPSNISVSHNSNVPKNTVTAEWVAPPVGSGELQIGFAVVRTLTVYWANQRSPLISESSAAATTLGEVTATFVDTTTIEPPTTEADTTDADTTFAAPGLGLGGDPHFSIKLPASEKQLCYSVQGEQGFFFNLISNHLIQMNALFVADEEREEVTWIGALGMLVKNAPYKDSKETTIRFDATKKSIQIGNDVTLSAKNIGRLTFKDGKLSISEARRGFNCSCLAIQVDLQDIGLNFSVHFVKNNHIDMNWDNVDYLSEDSHGLIGQFFRKGVDIDATRHLLLLPGMEPVPVVRKPIWHFMERDNKEDRLCWVAKNPGYQGKRLIQGSYLDYVVDDLLSAKFKM